MEYLLTASQNAEADRYTQDKIGIPQLVLMERAALSVREEIVKLDPSGTFSILIYCGRGNNGADGLALGRLLAEDGRSVQIYLLSEGGQISAAAAKQLSILQALYIPVLSFPSEEKEMPENPARTIVVDALIGIGFHGKIKASAAEAVSSIRKLSGKGAFVLAVDMPTGVNTDTGGADENAVRADLTVTFQYRKRGQVLYPGASYCGKTVIKSIGIVPPPEFSGKEKGDNLVFTMKKEDLSGLPPRPADGNKGTFGKVLLLAGSCGMAGASILAAAAALHTGAGMVRVITPESNRQILQARLPEAMVSCYPDDDPASISRDIEMYADWADSFAAGPGLGTGPAARTMLWTFMKAVSAGRGPRVLVLDADAWQTVDSLTEELSHANDLCYVPAAGEIYVLPMDVPQIIVLDEETFEVKRTIDVPQIYHAIGYDEDRDCFAAIYAEGKGSEKRLTCDILDNTCTKVLRSFPTDTNLVYQGLAVHDSKVYYSCWKREEGSTEHKTVYDDLLEVNDNVVYVYDYEGNLVDAMLIRMPEGYNTFEIEAVSFLGDRMILTFNENLADEDNTLMIGVWGQNSTSLE